MNKVDFDDLINLASTEPEQFELERIELLKEYINTCSPKNQQRLTGLQWTIDMTRIRSTSSIDSCVQISDQMWESLEKLNKIYTENYAALQMSYKGFRKID